MTTSAALARAQQLGDDELAARLRAHLADADRQALALGPLGLARYLDPRARARPHLRAISNALLTLKPGSNARVVIITPPQVGKSFVATWGGFWWLAEHPLFRNVIIGSWGTRLAANRGRTIRRYVNEHGHRYDLALERGSTSVTDWKLAGGGGVRSAGTRSGIAGDPADFALVDDPFSGRADAESRAVRDRVHDWWSGDLNARLSPGAPVLIVNTRWHPDDLTGRLLADEGRIEDGGVWRVVHLPALALAPDPADGIGPDGLGRAPGEPLTHPKIKPGDTEALLAHWEQKRRSSTPRDWASLYQGLPREEKGALLKRSVIKEARVRSGPEPVRTGLSIDPSGEGRSTAGIVAGYMAEDQRMYVTHDATAVMSIDEWSETACLLAREIDADVIYVERNFGGGMAANILRSAWRKLVQVGRIPGTAVMPFVQQVTARKGKRIRAEPMAQQVVLGNLKFLGIHPELEEKLATWVVGDPDSPGEIDALTHLTFGLLIGQPEQDGTAIHPADVDRNDNDTDGASGFSGLTR